MFCLKPKGTRPKSETTGDKIRREAAEHIVVLVPLFPIPRAVEYMVFEHEVTHCKAGTISTEVVVHVSNAMVYYSVTREIIRKVIWSAGNEHGLEGFSAVTVRHANADNSLASITLAGGEYDVWTIIEAEEYLLRNSHNAARLLAIHRRSRCGLDGMFTSHVLEGCPR